MMETARTSETSVDNYFVRFQVLTAASMMFRVVFWDILPCKTIIDRRFRGMCCLHHRPGAPAINSKRTHDRYCYNFHQITKTIICWV
jgi:hypothetical protein